MLVRAAAAELPRVGLEDALRICLILAAEEPGRYEPAAVRWLGRLLLEQRGVTLGHAHVAAAGLAALTRTGIYPRSRPSQGSVRHRDSPARPARWTR